MMHDEEAAEIHCPKLKIEPEKLQAQYKVHKIFRVGVKTRMGWVSGNNNFFPPYHRATDAINKYNYGSNITEITFCCDT